MTEMNYLRLSCDVVHTLVRPGENQNVVQFNQRQCAFLKNKLLETVTRFEGAIFAVGGVAQNPKLQHLVRIENILSAERRDEDHYLRLSRDVVHTLLRPGENRNVVQFTQRQCALLKNKLLETVMRILLLADLDSLPPEKQAVFLNCFKAVLLELYREECRGNHTGLLQSRLAQGSNQASKRH
ncbi:unnamed protein product [Sphagnum troendelagicum]|uniref:Uncharacterized protein n=1 Tax=Sphagnum troendelagicum TaxID=128251 RepID=A0ABP0UQL6_9BRYO